jgi:two-component system sporulation sensor kinase B
MKNDVPEKELPLYRKVLLFSFLITFIVVVSSIGTVFFYQSNQMEEQVSERAKGIASLWSAAVPADAVKEVLKKKDEDSSAFKKLNKIVMKIMKKNSHYYDGYIVIAKKEAWNKFTFITITKRDGVSELDNFTNYTSGKEFLNSYNEAARTKELTNTPVYHDLNGMWITAFKPILDGDGNVIAVFAANVNAAKIGSYKWKMGLVLLLSILLITAIIYGILRWGLKKVFEPVHEIISGINAVSAGNFDVKLEIEDLKDLAQLGENFNQMTEHLSILFDRLSDTYKEFGSNPSKINSTHRFEMAIDEMEKIMAKTKLQKQLQRAEKMNAIGQLAASVAHEIRNPMTVVRGFLQLFLASDHLTKEELAYVQLMIGELNRAEIIINDYLSLAKPDLEQIEKVNAGEVAANSMDLMNTFALMSKNITLVQRIEDDVYVKGNLSELKQVLINIIKNGIEAMKFGGTLVLEVKKTGSYGLFEITDTGVGMSEEELQRLGTAFYSLKEKGTGIGLMVCYQLIEKMKGTISVDSFKGKGTTFRIYIPLWNGN